MPNTPEVLERNINTIIIALSDAELGKIILPNSFVLVNAITKKVADLGFKKPNMTDEIAALQYANAVNDLMPKIYPYTDLAR